MKDMVSLAKGYDAEEGDYYKLYPSVSIYRDGVFAGSGL